MAGLLQKLRVKEDIPLYAIGLPNSCESLFDTQNVVTHCPDSTAKQIILFVEDSRELHREFQKLTPLLGSNSLLWIAYPKKYSGISTDLSRDDSWQLLFGEGWQPVTQVAINAEWSALRFKPIDQIGNMLRAVPMAERKTEGVDYLARTVRLPAEAITALNEHAGLLARFESQSFTCKKEWAEALASAKKPETRARRIEKLVAAMGELDVVKKRQGK
jgi:hypothetical protein